MDYTHFTAKLSKKFFQVWPISHFSYDEFVERANWLSDKEFMKFTFLKSRNIFWEIFILYSVDIWHAFNFVVRQIKFKFITILFRNKM